MKRPNKNFKDRFVSFTLIEETQDSTIYTITYQAARGFRNSKTGDVDKYYCSDGTVIAIISYPEFISFRSYGEVQIFLLGSVESRDTDPVIVPNAEHQAFLHAISEFNQAYLHNIIVSVQ